MPSGSVIFVSADAPEKVPVPESFCRLLGRLMVSSFVQPDTIDPEAISSTPSSKVRVFNSFHVLQSRIENFDTARNGDLSTFFEAG